VSIPLIQFSRTPDKKIQMKIPPQRVVRLDIQSLKNTNNRGFTTGLIQGGNFYENLLLFMANVGIYVASIRYRFGRAKL
jgi:hypothetical protein